MTDTVTEYGPREVAIVPAFATGHVTVYCGDALAVLRELPESSIDCVVTSPPYWGLRDYGIATWVGGDPTCAHGPRVVSTPNKGAVREILDTDRTRCARCDARRIDAQLGLEATPDEYVAAMVGVFREVGRVMRSTGTLWLNLGDSYAGAGAQYGGTKSFQSAPAMIGKHTWRNPDAIGLKPKDMVGIPWRLAFALQADGWYLRSDIIWAKPNPMPESVTDRPTKSHEYVFLLSKSERYVYDAAAIAEPATYAGRVIDYTGEQKANSADADLQRTLPRGRLITVAPTRNARSVWTIATQPYPEAHFATFPRELPERCIKAGSPEGGTVLDPFAGSGTTLAVARDLGRKSIGIELNPAYVKLIEQRCAQHAFDFTAASE